MGATSATSALKSHHRRLLSFTIAASAYSSRREIRSASTRYLDVFNRLE